MAQRWVCFDVGETLVDETRVWSIWADLLGVTRLTFMAALGAVSLDGDEHRDVFKMVGRPDWEKLYPAFNAEYGGFQESDLYPDAVSTIDALKRAGYRIAIFANQPARRTQELRDLGIEPDLMAMSGEWGVSKPATAFYERALAEMNAQPTDVAYVGDRLDNDVRPSAAAGIRPGVHPPRTLGRHRRRSDPRRHAGRRLADRARRSDRRLVASVKLTVVGCAPSYTTRPGRSSSAYLVEHGSTRVLLDLGTGSFPETWRYTSFGGRRSDIHQPHARRSQR